VGEVIEVNGLQQVLWPVHCVMGSAGAELLPGLDKGRIQKTIQKGTDPEIDSYSVFFDNGHRKATELQRILQQQGIRDIFLLGLATDYCVKFSVLDSVRLGFKTHLVLDGCRGVELTAGDVERSVDEMRTAGAEILNSEELIRHHG
jgi:nicotinamidase/pyrazinamidase